MRTFVDACVLIAACQGAPEVAARMFEILNDESREFVVSDFLKLEVIPKPTFHKFDKQVAFYNEFFKSAITNVSPSNGITATALEFACKYDLEAMDAIHVGVATQAKVEEFITLEKPERPINRVKDIRVISLYQPA